MMKELPCRALAKPAGAIGTGEAKNDPSNPESHHTPCALASKISSKTQMIIPKMIHGCCLICHLSGYEPLATW